MLAVTALALILVGILTLQSARGFGLENALEAKAKASVKRTLPDNATDQDVKEQEIEEGRAVGQYNVRHTVALQLVFVLLVVAAIGAALTFLMTRRADRPAPRFEFMW